MTSVIIIKFCWDCPPQVANFGISVSKNFNNDIGKHGKTTENRFLEGGDYQKFRLRRATIIMSTPTTDKFLIQLKNIVFQSHSIVFQKL